MSDPGPDNLTYINELSRLLHRATTSGGGNGDGGATAWQQSVETRLGQLHEDLRQIRAELDKRFGGLIAALVLIALAIVGGFAWMISRQDMQADRLAESLERLRAEPVAVAGRSPGATVVENPPRQTE